MFLQWGLAQCLVNKSKQMDVKAFRMKLFWIACQAFHYS